MLEDDLEALRALEGESIGCISRTLTGPFNWTLDALCVLALSRLSRISERQGCVLFPLSGQWIEGL